MTCNEYVDLVKDHHVLRHYETKHQSCTRCAYDNAYDDDRTLVPNEHRKSSTWQIACKLNNRVFQSNEMQENATIASYEAAKLIVKDGKPFSDGDFVKQCLIKVTHIMCPEIEQDCTT